MKVKELTVKLPQLKPRDPNQAVLASKKNAGGPMKDKKEAMKRGDFKHKGRAYEDMGLVEASLGSRMEYTDYDVWGDKRKALRQQIQPTLDALVKDKKARTTSYPAEDDVYYPKKPVKEEQLDEKKPAGAPDFHHSDAPDANGKFKELGVNDLADWLIKTRGGNLQKISGSLTQQIVFNRKKNPTYAKKMESVRNAVKRKLDKKD